MSLFERNLSKLTIRAYKDRESKLEIGSLKAMYNPDSINLDYQSRFQADETINNDTKSNRYILSEPAGLSLVLLFDARMPGNATPIETQLAVLKSICAVNASSDTPNFLRVEWGKMRWENKGYFFGRASGLSIHYSMFDRDATPLRAAATLTLVADKSLTIQENERKLQAPPVTAINVPDSASLPLIILASSASLIGGIDYLSLAWQNGMDNLNDFTPGQIIQSSLQGAI